MRTMEAAMYYHASPTPDIKLLEPRVSSHGVPLVYFSAKRENVLVYLSNAIEKYCRETGFAYQGPWEKWGPYGFDADGTLRLEEYYPGALADTYKGVPGYIYAAENVPDPGEAIGIPDAVASKRPVPVTSCEFIPDAWEAIQEAAARGRIALTLYQDLTARKREWIRATMEREYAAAENHPEYRHFIRGKFGIGV